MTRPATASEPMDLIKAAAVHIAAAERRIAALEQRVADLEAGTPQARQLQAELDATLADNAAEGYYPGEDW